MNWLKTIEKYFIGAAVACGGGLTATGLSGDVSGWAAFVAAILGGAVTGGVNWLKHRND